MNSPCGNRTCGTPALLTLVAILLMSMLAPLSAQPPDDLPPPITRWLQDARKECADFDNGKLRIDWKKLVRKLDITADGKPDHVLHALPEAITCSTALSYFCGTGGCPLLIVVNGTRSFGFLAHDWETGMLDNGKPLLAVGIHWSMCDYKQACRRLHVWNADSHSFKEIGLLWNDAAPGQD